MLWSTELKGVLTNWKVGQKGKKQDPKVTIVSTPLTHTISSVNTIASSCLSNLFSKSSYGKVIPHAPYVFFPPPQSLIMFTARRTLPKNNPNLT